MAVRSTRNKIKFQLNSSLTDMEGAQAHLIRAAALCKSQSEFLENSLSDIILSLELLVKMLTALEARV